jgi:aryl-alcohol dehydrogenase-like predicted oxidoreductase
LPHIPTYLAWDAFDSYQIPYSALERKHEDAITAVGEAGCGVIVRGGVAKGEPGAGQGNADRWAAWEQAGLDELLDEGQSRTAFILRFTITHPHCHTTIVGTKDPDHLAENIKAVEAGPLADDVYEEAKRRLDAAGQVPQAV